jgi:hypothetical protein
MQAWIEAKRATQQRQLSAAVLIEKNKVSF